MYADNKKEPIAGPKGANSPRESPETGSSLYSIIIGEKNKLSTETPLKRSLAAMLQGSFLTVI